MSQPLADCLTQVAARIARAPHVLLFLDYDGTLTPIVDRPEDAHLDPAVRDTVERLSSTGRTTVAIVSGRQLDDLRSRVTVRGAVYAGNHGMEISGEGFTFIEPTAVVRREALGSLCAELATRLAGVPGVRVEEKGLTASVHYRLTPREMRDHVRAVALACVESRGDLFRVHAGHMVCEVRPRIDWHKGAAVNWIVKRLELGHALPIYFGDDATDEDAFAVLSEGITVRVGESTPTLATYHLNDSAQVPGMLGWLADRLGQR